MGNLHIGALLRHQLFGREAFLGQHVVAAEVRLRRGEIGLRLTDGGAQLGDAGFETLRIDARQDLVGLYGRVEIHLHGFDRAGHRRAYIDRYERLQLARGAHGTEDFAPIRRGGAVRRFVLVPAPEDEPEHEQRGEGRDAAGDWFAP